MQLIEGTHYRLRENQLSLVQHKSKQGVDCLLCSDSGEDGDGLVGNDRRKRSRPIGLNIRLDRLHAHIATHHPYACREGARSLLTMGFTRRAVGAAAIAIEAHAPSASHLDPHIEVSGNMGTAALSPARQEPVIVASRSLAAASSAPAQRPSLPHVVSATPPTVIVERNMTTGSVNLRAFVEQVDTVIKANSAAQVIPSAEAIAEEVLREQQHQRTQQHGTGFFRELWKELMGPAMNWQ